MYRIDGPYNHHVLLIGRTGGILTHATNSNVLDPMAGAALAEHGNAAGNRLVPGPGPTRRVLGRARFGAGVAYDEIHVGPAAHSSFSHSDRDSSVAFYAESLEDHRLRPVVSWEGDDHLRVILDPLSRPGRRLTRVGRVSLAYQCEGTSEMRPNIALHRSSRLRRLPVCPLSFGVERLLQGVEFASGYDRDGSRR
jgi:hypothetical protein